jgi:hypothetical protein
MLHIEDTNKCNFQGDAQGLFKGTTLKFARRE